MLTSIVFWQFTESDEIELLTQTASDAREGIKKNPKIFCILIS